MELRQLRYFLSLAEELHFGRAAQREHIGQPALSLQVARLELEFGVKLFERTSRRVRLTDAGRSILDHARQAVRHSDAALQIARLAGSGRCGSLKVTYVHGTECGDSVELVAGFCRNRPDVRLERRTDEESTALERVRAGGADVAILWAPPEPEPGVGIVPLLSEEVVVAVGGSHHLARRRFVTGEDVLRETLVLPPRLHAPAVWTRLLAQLAGGAPFPGEVREEPSWLAVVRTAVREGGVGLLPACVAEWLSVEGVVCLRCCRPTLDLCTGLAWLEQDPSPILRAFIDHCRMQTPALRRSASPARPYAAVG